MNMFLKVILNFALCCVVSILPAFAEIPNHQIFYRQDKRAPLTKIEIIFLGAGSGAEQPYQAGLAMVVSQLIWKAVQKQGYMDQLEALGTRLNITTNTLYRTISIYGLSENSGRSIKIVRDFIYNLEFSESELQDIKKGLVADYRAYLRDYTFIKNFALSKTKGIKKHISLKTLKNLSLKDITQYYDQLLKTDVVFFKVISDLDSTEISKLLRPVIEKRETHLLQHGQAGGFVHSPKFPITDYNIGPTAFVFNFSGVKSIFCFWLIPCGNLEKEESYIPKMISRILVRYGTQGLLNTHFREELGLVYGPSCNLSSSEGIMFLEIFADPQFHNSEALIVKMSDFIRKLPDNPRFWAAIKELRESRNVIYAHELLTLQRRLDNEVYQAIYNSPTHKGGYDSVTDVEVRAFLEKFFVQENMIMLFLGPKDYIIDILNKHLPEVDIRIHDVKELIE